VRNNPVGETLSSFASAGIGIRCRTNSGVDAAMRLKTDLMGFRGGSKCKLPALINYVLHCCAAKSKMGTCSSGWVNIWYGMAL